MRARITYPALAHSSVAAFLLLGTAEGADGLWNAKIGGSWQNSANWDHQGIADGPGATGDFSSPDLDGNVTVTLDSPKTVGTLAFGDSNPSHDWFLRAGNGATLTLQGNSTRPVVRVENRTATIGLGLAGSEGLAKEGPGILRLAGNNSYSGPTAVNKGVLRLSSPPSFPLSMKVMPLGDSITFGYNGTNAGYRGYLYQMLAPLVPAFRYIGTSQERPGQLPAFPVDQRWNEGHSSYNIQDISNNLDGFDNTRFLLHGNKDRNPNGGFWFPGGNGTGRDPMFPDVITLMVGTNDLDQLPGAEIRLHALVDKITTQRPDARLFVAKITPAINHPGVLPYNAMVEEVLTEFQSGGKRVYLVDLHSGFPENGLIADGFHPNDIGFSWMATQWFEAVIQAYTFGGMQSPGIPAQSAVTIATDAVLDLDGHRATVASLESSGRLALGNGGELTAAEITLSPLSVIGGSGKLTGEVVHNGANLGEPGNSLYFSGSMTNNGSLAATRGASVQFEGPFVNNGVVNLDGSSNFYFTDTVVNNGVMRITGGAPFNATGSFINNGTLDMMTGPGDLPPNFVNHGVVLDLRVVKTRSSSVTEDSITLTIDSYTGHVYQLQGSSSLEEDSWVDLEEPQEGETGRVLVFTTPREETALHGFYRIKVDP